MVNRHIIDELDSYLDNQLKANQKEKIEIHLRDCQMCREELEKLKAVSEKLKVWQPSEPDADFHRAMSEALLRQEMERGTGKMKKKTLAILIPSGVLVSIVALLFVGQLVTQRGFQARLHDNGGVGGRFRANIDDVGEQYEPYQIRSESASALQAQTSPAFNRIMREKAKRDSFKALVPEVKSKGVAMQGAALNASIGSGNKFGSQTVNGWNDMTDFEAPVSGPVSYYSPPMDKKLAKARTGEFFGFEGAGMESGSSSDYYAQRLTGGYDEYKAADVIPQEELTTPQGPVIIVQPVTPATGSEEKIIRTGEVSLEVTDGKDTYQKTAVICKELGGYLADSQFYKDNEGRESGRIIMRIPQDKFLTALEKLGALGKVQGMNTSSQDVSQQYKALKAQLDISMVVYNKMMEAYQKKQVNINEAIRMESELTPILQRIENIKAEIEQLNNTVSMTTITVNFFEPAVSEKTLKESKNLIKETMLASAINSIKFMAAALPKLLILVVSLITIIVVSLVMKAWITNLFKKN